MLFRSHAQPHLVRALTAVGLDEAVLRIQGLGYEFAAARRIIFEIGLNRPIDKTTPLPTSSVFQASLEPFIPPKSETDKRIDSAISGWAGRILAEARDSLHYVQQEELTIEEIVLCCEGAGVPGIVDRFKSELAIPCQVYRPQDSYRVKSRVKRVLAKGDNSAETVGLALLAKP